MSTVTSGPLAIPHWVSREIFWTLPLVARAHASARCCSLTPFFVDEVGAGVAGAPTPVEGGGGSLNWSEVALGAGLWLDGAGAELRRHAPLLGADTEEVLAELP